ncbi:MAG TPA: circularly permuted type 2 ATP-grasp protein [Actinomycetota bacterium]|nr:circularly permuted type 2 ATP-grasp protein [Actinomycetota bacterium]
MTLLDGYDAKSYRDEALTPDGSPRDHYIPVLAALERIGADSLARRVELREVVQRSRGVTFTMRTEGADTERTFPLDLIPRIIPAGEWSELEAGLRQRVRAMNLFLADVYGEQAILHDRVVPWDMVLSSPQFQRSAWGIRPPQGVHVHVAGLDLVRGDDGRWLVLEDNLRVPSGASYVIENREVLTRVLPELFGSSPVRPVDHYPALLRAALRSAAPASAGDDPQIVLLTPGAYNAAYFEHTLLARHMGVPLVEGGDLMTESDVVYMRTTRGRERVDVIYRRVDDEFLDPLALRPDSLLGCPGLLGAARAGAVTIANAIGNGVADDKAMFAYVPAMTRYYLNEEPLLGIVPTFLCGEPDQRDEVLKRIDELVVKPVDASGGYGMLIGPASDEQTIEEFRRRIVANPRGYIAQEVVRLTRHPTLTGDDCGLAPRHVDLRPFIVQGGNRIEVLPGGLTRVALREGSLVVNSSQGGGSKDTWVLRDGPRGPSEPGAARRRFLRPMRDAGDDTALGWQQPQQQQSGAAPC